MGEATMRPFMLSETCPERYRAFVPGVVRVLLVDDDPRMVRAMVRVLETQMPRWEIVGVGSGEQALGALTHAEFQVIVSDVEMPEMDGTTLLRDVRERFPQVGRILMSAWTTEARLAAAAVVAHQFLWKPVSTERLVEAILQVAVAGGLLRDPALVARFQATEGTPPLPGTFRALQDAVNHPACTLSDITGVVSRDPAVSAHLLRMANSGWFGVASRTASLFKAVSLLGIARVRAVVLSHGAVAALRDDLGDGFDVARYQEHSVRVAALSQEVCPDPRLKEESFTAGLLHDLGWLMLHRSGALRERGGVEGYCFTDACAPVTHEEVAAYLFAQWGFESSLICAALFHHRPGVLMRTHFQPVDSVHIVEALLGDNALEQGCKMEFDEEHIRRLGLSQEIPRWKALLQGTSGNR